MSVKRKINILITNDDGILSDGSEPLAEAVSGFGNVISVLPDRMRSACSHSISLHKALRLRKIRDRVYVSDGTPVDCVRLGVLELFKDSADIVLSGINAGPNLGDDLNYSGTVAAAREAAFLGIKAVSVSLVLKKRKNYKSAADLIRKLMPYLLKVRVSNGAFLNVNIPDIASSRIKGIKLTRQGKRIYDRAAVSRNDPRGDRYYWLVGEKLSGHLIDGTDIKAVEDGFISISPLTLDHTSYGDLAKLEKSPKLREIDL